MIRGRDKAKNPLKQAQYGPRKFDWAPVGYVTICVLISAVWGYFDVITWFELYTGRDAEALAALAALCHIAALVSTLYINWRLPQSKLAGGVLIAGFLVFSGFNVFGGTQFVLHAAEEIEQARWVKAQFELDATRAKAKEAVDAAAEKLPSPCDKKSPTFTACRELYKAEFEIAKQSGDVARYNAAANKLAAISERAPRNPPYPWEMIAVGFAFLSLVMLTGPWAAGFGRPAQMEGEKEVTSDPASHSEPQDTLNPIPDDTSPPDGVQAPKAAVTPQEVEQNVPPPVPNPWPPTSYIEGGAAEASTPEARAEKMLREGESQRFVAAQTGLSRYAVGELVKAMKGKAA